MSQPTDLTRIEVIDDRIAEILRSKTPGERLAMGFRAAAFARMIVESGVRHANPSWCDALVKAEVLRRLRLGGS
jgi:hypothetical protein